MKRPLILMLPLLLLGAAGARAQVIDELLPGTVHLERTGTALAAIGDVDLDGHMDFAVALGATTGLAIGKVRVYSGAAMQLIVELDLKVPNSALDVCLAGGGDINGDGRPDLLVGTPRTVSAFTNLPQGAVRIYSGQNWSVLGSLYGNLAGAPQSTLFGYQTAILGDVDKDGHDDIAVSEPLFELNAVPLGRVMVFSGKTFALMASRFGPHAGCRFGHSLASVGDVNGNGKPDLAVGAPGQTESGLAGAGWFGVYEPNFATIFAVGGSTANGALGGVVAAAGDVNGDGRPDVAVHATQMGALSKVTRVYPGPWGGAPLLQVAGFGTRVAGVGDVNKDGRADLLLADPLAGPFQSGQAYVVSGSGGGTLWQVLQGTTVGDQFGTSIAALGDRDGDGWMDFVVGAPHYNGPTGSSAMTGAAYVVRAVVEQTDEGFGGPGDARLSVYGTPLGLGGSADLKLAHAPPSKLLWLVAATQIQPQVLYGGVLLPDPGYGVIVPVFSDAAGELLIPGIPGGGFDAVIHVQAITLDPATPHGVGLSNTVGMSFSA